jgi:hypothetical protein
LVLIIRHCVFIEVYIYAYQMSNWGFW